MYESKSSALSTCGFCFDFKSVFLFNYRLAGGKCEWSYTKF